MVASTSRWAHEELRRSVLGDSRRVSRALAVLEGIEKQPAGRVSEVFARDAQREGAYDFLENERVTADALGQSIFAATVDRAKKRSIVHVAIDGSTLSLIDRTGRKGFGPVGAIAHKKARGLLTMNALAVSEKGVPLGLVDQQFWNREEVEKLTDSERTKRDQHRPFQAKESSRSLESAKRAVHRLSAASVQPWVVIDRAGDSRDILLGLHALPCLFTVRASWNREIYGHECQRLHAALDAEPSLGDYEVDLPRTATRRARKAIIEVRAVREMLRFRQRPLQRATGLRLWVVRLRERVTAGIAPLEWILYTNFPVMAKAHAARILESYKARWRVEEFHRTWKSGGCGIEDTQLRSVQAVMKWATMHAAVATRIERLKYLSRKEPDRPATDELTEAEVEALRFDQQDRGKRDVPTAPTIAVATKWLAEYGGWIRRKDNMPGATVLERGFERLQHLVRGIALAKKLRRTKT